MTSADEPRPDRSGGAIVQRRPAAIASPHPAVFEQRARQLVPRRLAAEVDAQPLPHFGNLVEIVMHQGSITKIRNGSNETDYAQFARDGSGAAHGQSERLATMTERAVVL